MKTVLSICMVVLMVSFGFAGQGSSLYTQEVVLFSGTTGTTAQTAGTAVRFDYVVNKLGCSIISGMASTTLPGSVAIEGNMGGSLTDFDSFGPYLITTVTGSITPSMTVNRTRSVAVVDKPFRNARALVTTATTTQNITVLCVGSQ